MNHELIIPCSLIYLGCVLALVLPYRFEFYQFAWNEDADLRKRALGEVFSVLAIACAPLYLVLYGFSWAIPLLDRKISTRHKPD